jgi:hypothetical protein
VILELTAVPADRVEADCLVAFLHADDRPPPGVAGLLDWRLDGALSRLLKEGWYRAAAGEALLVAPGRRTRAPRLLVIGLGPRREADAGRLRSAGALALAKLAGLGVGRAVVGLPGPAEPPLPEAEQAVRLVEGFLETAHSPTIGSSSGVTPAIRPRVLLVVPVAAQEDTAAALASLAAGSRFYLCPLPASRGVRLPRPTPGRLLPSS